MNVATAATRVPGAVRESIDAASVGHRVGGSIRRVASGVGRATIGLRRGRGDRPERREVRVESHSERDPVAVTVRVMRSVDEDVGALTELLRDRVESAALAER